MKVESITYKARCCRTTPSDKFKVYLPKLTVSHNFHRCLSDCVNTPLGLTVAVERRFSAIKSFEVFRSVKKLKFWWKNKLLIYNLGGIMYYQFVI
jgi:hypothetical protein